MVLDDGHDDGTKIEDSILDGEIRNGGTKRGRGRPRNEEISVVQAVTGTSRRSAYRAKAINDAGLADLRMAGAPAGQLLEAIRIAEEWQSRSLESQEKFATLTEVCERDNQPQDGTKMRLVLWPGHRLFVLYKGQVYEYGRGLLEDDVTYRGGEVVGQA